MHCCGAVCPQAHCLTRTCTAVCLAGSLSDAMDAVTWAAGAEGQAAGIRVINLSLAAAVDPAAAGGWLFCFYWSRHQQAVLNACVSHAR